MDLSATYVFNAPASKVWELLMDINAVSGCLPGSRGLHEIGLDRYEVELGFAVAAIAGQFKGTVAIEDKQPPERYTLVVDASGRPGFVKGRAQIRLEAQDDLTNVHVIAHADAGGMIARVGQRLLEGVARSTMDNFYACLAKRVSW
jgi:carbon monoxide dehydrogenase subunit G